MRQFIFLLFLSALLSCSSDKNKFADPISQKIGDFQDHRKADSLIRYLIHKDPKYRTEAATALASVQDTIAALQLGTTLLEDPSAEARIASAFALGQTGGIAATNALIPALGDKNTLVVSEVLQSLGKVARGNDLESLVKFEAKDSVTQAGWAWGMYYLGVRGLADSLIAKKMSTHLRPENTPSVRLAAAHFFNRASNISIQSFQKEITDASRLDKNVFVRMAATGSLRKIRNDKSVEALKSVLSSEADYRVRISASRALGAMQTLEATSALLTQVDHKNANVGVAASDAIKTSPELKDNILAKARASKNWLIQSNLYKSVLAFAPSDSLASEIHAIYSHSNNDYQRASLLNSLASDPKEYAFIKDQLLIAKVPVIKTSAAQALVAINYGKTFTKSLQAEFAHFYQQAIEDGDAGVIGIVASALGDSSLHYKDVIRDFSFLTKASQKLALPKDIETLQPLKQAIAYFEGTSKPANTKNAFNHPISWDVVNDISKNQKVIVKTTKGDITLVLLVEEAPGSVANFIDLVNKKYFDGKYFHRVVPNFVIQTGCNRGDGFGSEDYSIRSEFAHRKYGEGSVGMASAVKDTEGTQWFITHSPTPHLDGRYTIFAEVTSGMNIVHEIEIGDRIISASLVKN